MTAETQSKFQKWYADNKSTLSERRKKRYREDPVYRQTVKDRAAKARAAKQEPVPSGMATLRAACEYLGVESWTLNRWRNLNYYPDPTKVAGRVLFTAQQVDLLKSIKDFFDKYPNRSAALHRAELDTITTTVHHNWS